nr:hypothetical protein [uncultured Pseudomonas sp.]
MSRKPVHLSMAGGKEPRQNMWESIRTLRAGFTASQVAARTSNDDRAVEAYLEGLGRAGIIEVVELNTVNYRKSLYRLVKDEGLEHPRVNIKGDRTKANYALENIWRSLRILGGEVTAEHLASSASVAGTQVSAGYAARYLVALAQAGYVVHTKGVTGRPATFALVPGRYTGPKHPIVQRHESMQVYDPNLDEVVYARTSGNPEDPVELTWLRLENKRLRELLGQWLEEKDINGADRSLIERTQLEMIPMPRSAMQ